MLLLTESTLFFLNLTSEFRSATVGSSAGQCKRRIHDWNSDVPNNLSGHQRESVLGSQSASIPPSTIFSPSEVTTASKATTAGSHCPPQKPDISDISDILEAEDSLVGGFGDEDVDDADECPEDAFQKARNGRMQTKVCRLHIHPIYISQFTKSLIQITDSIEEIATAAVRSQPKKPLSKVRNIDN